MSDIERPGGLRGPVRPRRPEDFEQAYEGTPPWDIGRPQPAFVELARAGAIQGRVLDSGCGTGEHTLMAAELGLSALGVDRAAAAIAIAEGKARDRGLAARFKVADALELEALGEQFDTVLDSGLFHIFDDADRVTYIESLAAVMSPGGRLYLMCFSDHQPGDWGPRRVSEQELIEGFGEGWRIESIDESKFDITISADGALAWRVVVTRT